MRRAPLRLLVLALALAVSGLGVLLAQDEVAERRAGIRAVGLELSGADTVDGGCLLLDDELVGSVLFLTDDDLARATPDGLRATLVKLERARDESEPYTTFPRLFPVQDFEDLASDGKDTVYLLGSHAPKQDGSTWHRRTDREFLIKAEWRAKDRCLRVDTPKKKGGRGDYRQLLDHLLAHQGPKLLEGFNVEGLALHGKDLVVGLRAPLTEGAKGKAILFSAKEKDLFGKKSLEFDGTWDRLELDLAGGGVRGLHWDEVTRKLLVLSGPSVDGARAPSVLWAYEPEGGALERVRVFTGDELTGLGAPEGICRATPTHLLVAFDAETTDMANMLLVRWPTGS